MKKYITLFIIVMVCMNLTTCNTLGKLGNTFLDDINIDPGQIQDMAESLATLVKSAEDFSPEQEYYIGRAVGAVVLDQNIPYENEEANNYLNTLGQTLAVFSDRPEIYLGYRFLILDSEEINAFATPSGLVFVTRGLLMLSTSEDSVAAILAHEIGHIVKKHGLQSIKQARMTAAVTGIVVDTANNVGIQQIEELTANFSDSINDITTKLVVNGYSREYEKQADAIAVDILLRVGYNPTALVELLETLDESYTSGGLDFAKTHPDPEKRIDAIEDILKGYDFDKIATPLEREIRFREFYKELG